ncbi:hypothetical protein POM88_015878 [Heracleum sosnowskyi]|uniref:Uncharacterized protein n=1 Tax=Heracleum sosnowskyi TaxID=360622 RepID=A0AAD8IPI2_9APIA|nr:hypothetical protein POM88_015878 [Heracleum sosnowskyi]
MVPNPFSGALSTFYSFSNTVSTLYPYFRGFSISFDIGSRSRMCGKSGCRGYKNVNQFELRLQSEKCLKSGGKAVEEVDQLPQKEVTDAEERKSYTVSKKLNLQSNENIMAAGADVQNSNSHMKRRRSRRRISWMKLRKQLLKSFMSTKSP